VLSLNQHIQPAFAIIGLPFRQNDATILLFFPNLTWKRITQRRLQEWKTVQQFKQPSYGIF